MGAQIWSNIFKNGCLKWRDPRRDCALTRRHESVRPDRPSVPFGRTTAFSSTSMIAVDCARCFDGPRIVSRRPLGATQRRVWRRSHLMMRQTRRTLSPLRAAWCGRRERATTHQPIEWPARDIRHDDMTDHGTRLERQLMLGALDACLNNPAGKPLCDPRRARLSSSLAPRTNQLGHPVFQRRRVSNVAVIARRGYVRT